MGSHQPLSEGTSASESAKLGCIASEYAFFQRHFMFLVTLTIAEACKYLDGISSQTLRLRARDNHVQAYKQGLTKKSITANLTRVA
jgi:hypothetical protein